MNTYTSEKQLLESGELIPGGLYLDTESDVVLRATHDNLYVESMSSLGYKQEEFSGYITLQ